MKTAALLRAALTALGCVFCAASAAQTQILFRDQMEHPDTMRAADAIDGRQFEQALNILPARTEAGDAAAQILLGVMHRDGLGTPRDGAQALKWLSRAAAQATAKADLALIAASHLGKMYDDGLAVPRDVPEAMRWYKQSGWAGQSRYRDLAFFRADTPVIIRERGYDDYDPRTLEAAAERNAYVLSLIERLRARVVRPPGFPRGASVMFDVSVDARGKIVSVSDLGVSMPDNAQISQDALLAARASIAESVRNSSPWPLPPSWISLERKVRIRIPDDAVLEAERRRDPAFPAILAGRHELHLAVDAESLQVGLNCVPGKGCRLETTVTDGGKPLRSEQAAISVEPAANVDGLRGAFLYARAHAREATAGEKRALHRVLLPELGRDLGACHALLGEQGASMYFCALQGSTTLLYFAPIMECGGGFCGYAIMPLAKVAK
ncbi:MAG: sel1 repeat family protein [Burkholderiales bacterium]|nr:sel1 repeat family protein [Burkholderiales bacterium]